MKTFLSYFAPVSLFITLLTISNSSYSQITSTEADPAVITITQQGPSDPAPIGSNIAGNTVFKFRVANNSSVPGPTGTIPAGALTYTVQFNPYYTFTTPIATSEFSVTFTDASTYVIQLTNSVPLAAGDVLDFYLNVKPTSTTTNPAGEVVTLNVDRTVPIQTGNTSTGNDNVEKRFTVSVGGPLPVESITLTSVTNGSKVMLKWNTESEMNTEKFIVERSTDGRSFQSVHETPASGTTLAPKTYEALDDVQSLGAVPVVFYRIKVLDLDGKYSYSNINIIRFKKQGKVQVWPNPFSNQLNLQVEQTAGAVLEVRVYNLIGKMIFSKQQNTTAGINTIQLTDQLSKLSGGMYVIELLSNKEKIYSETIIKQ